MLQITPMPELRTELAFLDKRPEINVKELERLLGNEYFSSQDIVDQETRQQILRSIIVRMQRIGQFPRRIILKSKSVK